MSRLVDYRVETKTSTACRVVEAHRCAPLQAFYEDTGEIETDFCFLIETVFALHEVCTMRDSTASFEVNTPTEGQSKAYEGIAASCWRSFEPMESMKSQSGSDSAHRSLAERVADRIPPMPPEDVAKLSEDIVKTLMEDGDLSRVGGSTFGYMSAMQCAWSEAGQKGVQQVVDKVNEGLKANGSSLRLSLDGANLQEDSKGNPLMNLKFNLTDQNRGRIDSTEYGVVPFAQRNMSKEQVEDGMPLMVDIVKSGKFGEDFLREFVENYFRAAMGNGNLDQVTKEINDQLEKAGSQYRIDAKQSTWEKHSDKFGEFDHQRTDKVTVNLVDSKTNQVSDTAHGVIHALGVINNRIDLPPRWRDQEREWREKWWK